MNNFDKIQFTGSNDDEVLQFAIDHDPTIDTSEYSGTKCYRPSYGSERMILRFVRDYDNMPLQCFMIRPGEYLLFFHDVEAPNYDDMFRVVG